MIINLRDTTEKNVTIVLPKNSTEALVKVLFAEQPVEALISAEKSLYLHVYLKNAKRISKGHFVIGNELVNRLYIRLLAEGYKIPNLGLKGHRIRPDKALGPLFHDYLLANKIDVFNKFCNDEFTDENGEVFFVRQYKIELLPLFVEYFENIWLIQYADKYFKERDPNCLEFLERIRAVPDISTQS